MSRQKMIKVPFMKMPECCDECVFGRINYSYPFLLEENVWTKSEKIGKRGYNCQLEYYEKGRYETVREAPIDEHIVSVLCPLIKANKELNPNCDILKPIEDK